jgi:hypothetical protein
MSCESESRRKLLVDASSALAFYVAAREKHQMSEPNEKLEWHNLSTALAKILLKHCVVPHPCAMLCSPSMTQIGPLEVANHYDSHTLFVTVRVEEWQMFCACAFSFFESVAITARSLSGGRLQFEPNVAFPTANGVRCDLFFLRVTFESAEALVKPKMNSISSSSSSTVPTTSATTMMEATETTVVSTTETVQPDSAKSVALVPESNNMLKIVPSPVANKHPSSQPGANGCIIV